MKFLFDTHTWIWYNMRPQNLSRGVAKLMGSGTLFNNLIEKGRHC